MKFARNQAEKNLLIMVLLFITSLVVTSLFFDITHPQNAEAEIQSAGCTASSSRVVIGNQASTMVVASSSNRATLHVEQPDVASNTVYFRLAQGLPATTVNGTIVLEKVSTTSSRSKFDIGKNTDLPYVGAVTAITDVGSTTVLVTECIY